MKEYTQNTCTVGIPVDSADMFENAGHEFIGENDDGENIIVDTVSQAKLYSDGTKVKVVVGDVTTTEPETLEECEEMGIDEATLIETYNSRVLRVNERQAAVDKLLVDVGYKKPSQVSKLEESLSKAWSEHGGSTDDSGKPQGTITFGNSELNFETFKQIVKPK